MATKPDRHPQNEAQREAQNLVDHAAKNHGLRRWLCDSCTGIGCRLCGHEGKLYRIDGRPCADDDCPMRLPPKSFYGN